MKIVTGTCGKHSSRCWIVLLNTRLIQSVAFMIPNRKPQKSLQSFAVSIDKLEEVTQLDFLNLLPQQVQEQL
ncbi:MAG: hypothetical protein QGI86_27390 [Candidatus Poribacteria bacterium]|nr:hypothetical protein [Candidatus Poribacteria bacterium]